MLYFVFFFGGRGVVNAGLKPLVKHFSLSLASKENRELFFLMTIVLKTIWPRKNNQNRQSLL